MFGTLVVEVGRGGGVIRLEAVDVDSDVVVVDVAEFKVLDRIEFDSEEVVGEVAEVGGIEKAEILAGEGSREVFGGGDSKGKAVAAKLGVLGDYGEDKGGGEGEVGGVGETDRRRVEGVADEAAGVIGEAEDAIGLDGGDPVEGYVAGALTGESVIVELIKLGGIGVG